MLKCKIGYALTLKVNVSTGFAEIGGKLELDGSLFGILLRRMLKMFHLYLVRVG